MSIVLFYGYLAAALVIGCLCARKIQTPDDYYVAGRRAGVCQLAGSLLATILGSSAILGSIDFAYSKGWAGAWFMLCGALGLLGLLFLVKAVSAFRGYNLPMLLGKFYGKEVQKLSAGVIAVAWLGVVGAQVIGAAEISSAVFGIPYTWAVVAVGLTLTFYTAAGGQLSIIRTDLIQVLLIYAGLGAIAAVLLARDSSASAQSMISNSFTWMDLIVMVFAYSSTYLVGPDIYSRLFCAKDAATARKAVAATAIVLIPTAFILAFVGIYAAHHYVRGDESALFMVAKGEFPFPIVLLLFFSMLSAIMSSADTTLFTAGVLLSQFFREKMDTRESMRLTMLCTAGLGILSIAIALFWQSILTVFLFALGIYAGAFVMPVVWGLLGMKSSRHYAMAAILTGGILALAGKIVGGNLGNALVVAAFPLNLAILALGHKRAQHAD